MEEKIFAQAESWHAINPGQYGGWKGHEVAYLSYTKELKNEIYPKFLTTMPRVALTESFRQSLAS
jgi:hypothetical protein